MLEFKGKKIMVSDTAVCKLLVILLQAKAMYDYYNNVELTTLLIRFKCRNISLNGSAK